MNKTSVDSKNLSIDILLLSFRIELKMFYTIYNDLMNILNTKKLSGFNEYMETSFKYRSIVSNINNLLATWEQQLYSFIQTYTNRNINNHYKKLKQEFYKNFSLRNNLFEKIEEYRHLVNVLKHGESTNSYTELQKINSKFLQPSNEYKYLKEGHSFNIPILNISKDTIKEISDTLESFWKCLDIV